MISADRIAELSNGMLRHSTHVRINRPVIEHDVTVIVSPVFPHEVVGFSGGNKYLFPGVSGRELIDLSHWLGALTDAGEDLYRLRWPRPARKRNPSCPDGVAPTGQRSC